METFYEINTADKTNESLLQEQIDVIITKHVREHESVWSIFNRPVLDVRRVLLSCKLASCIRNITESASENTIEYVLDTRFKLIFTLVLTDPAIIRISVMKKDNVTCSKENTLKRKFEDDED